MTAHFWGEGWFKNKIVSHKRKNIRIQLGVFQSLFALVGGGRRSLVPGCLLLRQLATLAIIQAQHRPAEIVTQREVAGLQDAAEVRERRVRRVLAATAARGSSQAV